MIIKTTSGLEMALPTPSGYDPHLALPVGQRPSGYDQYVAFPTGALLCSQVTEAYHPEVSTGGIQ